MEGLNTQLSSPSGLELLLNAVETVEWNSSPELRSDSVSSLEDGWQPTPTSTVLKSIDQNDGCHVDEGGSMQHNMASVTSTRWKKRAQTALSCSRCRSTHKKCDETRPCKRCVKVGIWDCQDAPPRGKGAKHAESTSSRRSSRSVRPKFEKEEEDDHTGHSRSLSRPARSYSAPRKSSPIDPVVLSAGHPSLYAGQHLFTVHPGCYSEAYYQREPLWPYQSSSLHSPLLHPLSKPLPLPSSAPMVDKVLASNGLEVRRPNGD